MAAIIFIRKKILSGKRYYQGKDIMWPSKKDNKEETISNIASALLEFNVTWRSDKKEVMIMTEDGPVILDETTEFFIDISNDNFNPIKIQLIPDFKNRKLNAVEIIDPNIKFDENKGIIRFSSVSQRPNKKLVDTNKSISMCIEELEKGIEIVENDLKYYEKTKRAFILFYLFLTILSAAAFIISTSIIRYLYLLITILCVYRLYKIRNNSRKIYEKYDDIKATKDNIFGIAKNK